MKNWIASLTFLQTLKLSNADFLYGLRMAIVIALPLIIGPLIGESNLAGMCLLGGLYTGLGGISGTYRMRAVTMSCVVVSIVIATLLATSISTIAWLAVLVALVVTFALAFMGLYGPTVARASFMVVGVFSLMLSEPGTPQESLPRAIAVLIGGLWSMVVALWIWPLRPFQHQRQALAGYYRALATYCSEITTSASRDKSSRGRVWEAHNRAHSMVVTPHTTSSETPLPMQRLFLLTLHADRLFRTNTSLAKFIAHPDMGHPEFQSIRDTLQTMQQEVASMLRQIAASILNEKHAPDMTKLDAALNTLKEQEQALRLHYRPMLSGQPTSIIDTPIHRIHLQPLLKSAEYRALVHVLHTVNVMYELVNTVRIMTSTINEQAEEEQSLLRTVIRKAYRPEKKRIFQQLVDNLTPRSIWFRHALRFGITMALGVAIYHIFNIEHGFWIELTIMICLKANFSATSQKSVERLGFTVFGAALAAVLVALIHSADITLLFIAVCAFFAFSYYQGNYKAYVIFITPFSLLLASLAEPGYWEIALLRFGNTLIGGLLALIAIYLFWPQWERQRLPKQLARAIALNRSYLHMVLAAYQNHIESNLDTITRTGKAAQQASIEAEAAYQRLLDEPRAQRGNVEQWDTLVTYNQQVHECITTLANHIPTMQQQWSAIPQLQEFITSTEELLQQMEIAILAGKQPQRVERFTTTVQHMQTLLQSLIADRLYPQNHRSGLLHNGQTLQAFVPFMTVLDELAQYTTSMYQAISK